MVTMWKRMVVVAAITLMLASVVRADPAPIAAPPLRVAGSVVTSGGKPAPGATVTVTAYDFSARQVTLTRTVPVNAGGAFETTLDSAGMPANTFVAVYATAPSGVAVGSVFAGRANRPLTMALRPFGSVTVRVADAAGKPVSGVHVAPDAVIAPDGSVGLWRPGFPAAWSAVTDATGCATIDRLPRGDWMQVDVLDPQYAHLAQTDRWTIGAPGSGPPQRTVTLVPAQSISGRLTLGTGGPPAQGYEVTAQSPAGLFTEARTDSDGRYRIDRAGAGPYSLRASPPAGKSADWLSAVLPVTMLAGTDLVGQDLAFSHGGEIRGRVTDPTTGKPVAGVQVSAGGGPINGFATTDTEGRYAMRVLAGGYQVAARVPVAEPMPAPRDVQVAEGNVSTADFSIAQPPPMFTARGIVLLPDGKPAEGAEVWLAGPGRASMPFTTRADGAFAFDGIAATDRFGIYARLGSLGTARPVAPMDGNAVTVPLSRGVLRTVRASVTDTHGKPIAGADVQLDLQSAGGSMFTVESAKTDGKGRYTFQPTFAGARYLIGATAPHDVYRFTPPFDVAPGLTADDGPVIALVKADSFVGGTVVDTAGKPIAGANVRCQDTSFGAPYTSAVTDATGRFHLDGVPPVKTGIVVEAPDGRFAVFLVPSGVDNDVIAVRSNAEIQADARAGLAMLAADQASLGDSRGAPALLAKAEQVAVATDRKVFLIFHASWCGPCRALERYLQAPAIKQVVEAHFVVQEIDTLETDAAKKRTLQNPGGGPILLTYTDGRGSGIPYSALLDAQGRKLGEYVGAPTNAGNVEDFINTLRKADPRMSDADAASLRRGFRSLRVM
jgi:thiol-disulfide isomerase/thioredoxin